jgi:hypothetical protein
VKPVNQKYAKPAGRQGIRRGIDHPPPSPSTGDEVSGESEEDESADDEEDDASEE